jgi:hypothetical protein
LPLLSNLQGNRRRAILLPIGLMMLCMAVFGWGLQYKLSLYQGKDSISHLAPVAKLLSQEERPVAGKTLVARRGWASAWPVFLILVMAFGLCPAAVRYLRTGGLEGSRSPFLPCLQDIFVRPPPVHSFLLKHFHDAWETVVMYSRSLMERLRPAQFLQLHQK